MNGQCLCGETAFEVVLKNEDIHACHCGICRRQTSGVIMTIDIVEGSLKFINHAHLSIFKSSEWGERGFCHLCGTNLFWRTQDLTHTNINVFALNDLAEDLKFSTEIYIDHKPSFYAFDNHTEKLTEADVIALFSEQQKI